MTTKQKQGKHTVWQLVTYPQGFGVSIGYSDAVTEARHKFLYNVNITDKDYYEKKITAQLIVKAVNDCDNEKGELMRRYTVLTPRGKYQIEAETHTEAEEIANERFPAWIDLYYPQDEVTGDLCRSCEARPYDDEDELCLGCRTARNDAIYERIKDDPEYTEGGLNKC